MPVIKLTIMKPLSTVCFSVYSVLVEHCGSWINDFHPCLGLHSLPSIVCACVSSNSTPAHKRLTAKIWYSQTEKASLSESRVAWLGRTELWTLSPCGTMPASQSHYEQCSQHLGNIKFWSSCLWYFLLCSWHIWTQFLTHIWILVFVEHLPFPPMVGLLVIPLDTGILYTFYGLLHLSFA